MAERWRRWETAGLLAVLLAGNLLHFVYAWSGNSPIAALFAAVNESTWEHMKLLAVPWVLWSLVEAAALGREGGAALCARAEGLLAGLAAIPVLFYTYCGVLGRSIHLLNILLFQLAVLLAWWVSRRVWRGDAGRGCAIAGALLMLLVWALFAYWTFKPPALPLFADPVTGMRGVR